MQSCRVIKAGEFCNLVFIFVEEIEYYCGVAAGKNHKIMLGLRDKRNKKGRKVMLATIKLKEKTRNWCLECYTLCSHDEVVIKNANNSERERKQTNKQRKSWQYHWRERQRRNRENKTQTQKEKNRERGCGIRRKSDLTGRRRRVRRSCLGNLAT